MVNEEKNSKDGGGGKADESAFKTSKKVTAEIKNQNKEKEKTLTLEERLREEGLEIIAIQRDLTDEVKNLTKEIYGSAEASAQINKAFRDMSRITRDVASNWENIYDGSVKEEDIAKQITKAKKAGNKVSLEANLLMQKGGLTQKQITEATKGGLEIDEKKLKGMGNLSAKEKELLLHTITTLKTNKENLEILKAQEKKLKEANTGLVKGLNAAADVMGKIGLGEFSGPMKAGAEAARMAALEGGGFFKQMSAAGGAIKAMMGPLIAIGVIMAGFKFDKQITDLQKGMGISKSEAFGLKMEMSGAAAASGDMAINSERMLKTFSMLQSQLGIAANFSTEMTEDATVLSEKLGLSEKATANFAQSSLVVGKSIDEQYKSSLGIINSIQVQTGAMIPYKETLEKAGNITGQIRAQLGGSLEEITKAVGVAASLGMELEQVAKSGESMLNFQSSIEAELEAELLTGKELNLEKARLLALTGDYEGLAKEISKEAGNFTEFSKMNVLQQNALAKSLGMSSNEMSDMLMKEEMIGQTKESALAAGNEDLAKRIEARDLQQEMGDAVMKLKGVFVDLVGGPVGQFLNLLTLALTPIGIMLEGLDKITKLFSENKEEMTAMEATLGTIAGIFLAIKGSMLLIKGVQVAINVAKGIGLAFDIASNKGVGKMKTRELSKLGRAVALTGAKIFGTMMMLGPILGPALGLAGVAAMAGTVYGLSRRKAEKGGMIGGNRHSAGGTIIEAEQGEFIMSRQGVQSVGVDNLYAMNRGGGISGGKAQAGGVVQSTSGQSNSGMNMQSFTDAVISAVNNTKPGVVIASPYGLNNTNYQSRNENFKTKFE
jgi:hypothetical protein